MCYFSCLTISCLFRTQPFVPCSLPFNFDEHRSDLWSQIFCSRDSRRIKVGNGRRDFEKAKGLLRSWEHFSLGWAYTNAPKIAIGEPVIVVAQSLGMWTINPLRIDSSSCTRNKLTFSHKTVKGHQISGRETFSVQLDKDGSVWYSIDTISKPDTWISTLSYPILRLYQHKFKCDSMACVSEKLESR